MLEFRNYGVQGMMLAISSDQQDVYFTKNGAEFFLIPPVALNPGYSYQIVDAIYANSTWVVLMAISGGLVVAGSNNNKDWFYSTYTESALEGPATIAYDNGYFLISSIATSTSVSFNFLRSSDGLTWTKIKAGTFILSTKFSAKWSYNGFWIACGYETNGYPFVISSGNVDATSWGDLVALNNLITPVSDTHGTDFIVSVVNLGTLIIGYGGSSYGYFMPYSNGVWVSLGTFSMTYTKAPAAKGWHMVAWNGTFFIAVGYGTNYNVFKSTNGTSWTSYRPSNLPDELDTVVYFNNFFWVYSTYNNQIYRSSDGINYTLVSRIGSTSLKLLCSNMSAVSVVAGNYCDLAGASVQASTYYGVTWTIATNRTVSSDTVFTLTITDSHGVYNETIQATIPANYNYVNVQRSYNREQTTSFTVTGNVTTSATGIVLNHPSASLTISAQFSISASPNPVFFALDVDSKSIVITCNTSWQFDVLPTWISVNKTSGTGNATVTMTTLRQTSSSSVTVVIIAGGSLNYNLTVVKG